MSEMRSRNEHIHELRRRGQTLAEIGERFGISRERVRQIVNRPLVRKDLRRRRRLYLYPFGAGRRKVVVSYAENETPRSAAMRMMQQATRPYAQDALLRFIETGETGNPSAGTA